MSKKYLFQSERLGFRNWATDDITPMAAINADPDVMKYLPGTQTEKTTKGFIERMSSQFEEKGFCYFAVDELKAKEFIGFIGLSKQTYEADFTPCIDIGWRLSKEHWGKGYATEGAQRCMQFGFNQLNLEQVLSIAAKNNLPSINIMKKIGMSKIKEFDHPLVLNDEKPKLCVLYMKER